MQSNVTDIAETILAVSGALSVVLGATWAIAKYTLHKELMPSLRAHKDEFKSFNSGLYEQELRQTEESARAIDGIVRTMADLTRELTNIRISIGKHDETLVALPGILTNLNDTLSRHARTDDRLGDVLAQLSKDVGETKVHVAHIMGKLSMEPRREPSAIATATPAR